MRILRIGILSSRNNINTETETIWNLNSVVYDSKSFDPAEFLPGAARSLFIKPDGLKLYCFNSDGIAYQYTLSTAFDISTASYDSVSFDATAQITSGWAMFISPDGINMYLSEWVSGAKGIYQYTLSTPWLLSSATYSSNSLTGIDSPFGIYVSNDGNKLIYSTYTHEIYYHTLSTAWDLSTVSSVISQYDPITQDTDLNSVFMSSGGTNMYITGDQNSKAYQYTLSSPWSPSSATYSSKSFDFTSQGGNPNYMFITGNKMYAILGGGGNLIYQYSI